MGRKHKFLRDSQGTRVTGTGKTDRPKAAKPTEPLPPVPGDLSSCERWAAIRERVVAKQSNGSTGR